MVFADARLGEGPELPAQLAALKAELRADLTEFRREVFFRLPAALEGVSASEIRQHLGPFLEKTFHSWAERENAELKQALAAIAERWVPGQTGSPPSSADEALADAPDSRLFCPRIEVNTFALDAGVVAALALGVGTIFANAAVGGLFLLAAPALASVGQERGRRALQKRAAEAATKAVDEAVAKLGLELERVIDDFGRRIERT